MFFWIVFIPYSFVFLLYQSAFTKFNFLLLGFTLLVITKYLLKDVPKTKEFITFQIVLLIYGFWVILSGLMHYHALSILEPLTYITIDKKDVVWGLQTIKDVTAVYISFPILFFIAIYLCKSCDKTYKILYLLPVVIIPSLAVAIYQGCIDIEYLNKTSYTSNRVSGLDLDSNGLGLSFFLLFPLCMLAIFQAKNLFNKAGYVFLIAGLTFSLFLSGSRTGLIGTILFICILPWIWIWANDKISNRKRLFLILAPLIIILLIGTVRPVLVKEHFFSSSLIAIDRLNSTYLEFKDEGGKKVFQHSGRYDMGVQAYRLTKMSPLSGWGPGGFYRNLLNTRLRNNEESNRHFDNANNHYFQMISELGVLGASLNLFLHLFPLWMIYRIKNNIQDRRERLAAGIVFATVSIMMLLFITGPHTMTISVQWIFVVLLSFLVVTAFKHGYSFKLSNRKLLFNFILLTTLFYWGTYNNAFGKEGYKLRYDAAWWPYKYERNCYELEHLQVGRARWCKNNSSLQIRIDSPLSENVTVNVSIHHPDTLQKPVTVKYGGKTGAVHEVVFNDRSWKTITVPLTEDYIYEYISPAGGKEKFFILSLDVSRTWVPKEWGINEDTRELGVLVLIPDISC